MHHSEKRSSDTDETPAPGGRSHDSMVGLTSAVAATAAVCRHIVDNTNNYSHILKRMFRIFFCLLLHVCVFLSVLTGRN